MKTLPQIVPTAEQLPLISDGTLGVEVIRGAAGSGKTSTAILRLQSLTYLLEERREREGSNVPVRILVLTFNRTLAGYVGALVEEQVEAFQNTEVTVDTFGHWAMQHVGYPTIVDDRERERKIAQLAVAIPNPSKDYIVKEVEYLLGRFRPDDLESYITAERTGRGSEPRVDRALRRRILDEVVEPYKEWLNERGEIDWNDLALQMEQAGTSLDYDIVIVDESQDFSANQLRALRRHIAEEHAVTFVIDTVQRIYARGFTWAETGFDMRRARYHRLEENHRNTREIAAFAAGLLSGIAAEPDGALPNLRAATRTGSRPAVVTGFYRDQVDWAISYINANIDLKTESVAFLKPQGGVFFRELKRRLDANGLCYADITRQNEWPAGDENIALSTFHSAKGLEFDHVFILGLANINTEHGDAAADDQLTVLRRLTAVAVARARNTLVVGYKPGEESRLVDYFDQATFDAVNV